MFRWAVTMMFKSLNFECDLLKTLVLQYGQLGARNFRWMGSAIPMKLSRVALNESFCVLYWTFFENFHNGRCYHRNNYFLRFLFYWMQYARTFQYKTLQSMVGICIESFKLISGLVLNWALSLWNYIMQRPLA